MKKDFGRMKKWKTICAGSLAALLMFTSIPVNQIVFAQSGTETEIETGAIEISDDAVNEKVESAPSEDIETETKNTDVEADTKPETDETAGNLMLTCEVEDYLVTLTADAGVFPQNVSMQATLVDNAQELESVESVVEQQRKEARTVSESYVFDIKVYDEIGNEVQPDTAKGKVQVSFAMAKEIDENREVEVYHIKDEAEEGLVAESLTVEKDEAAIDDRVEIESVEQKVQDNNAADAVESVLTVDTDGFSYYVVEFTVGDLQYVLDGDSSVPLSTILDTLHMSGIVTAAKGSDDSLFTVTKDETGDDWTVTAVTAFTSNETLDLTINGVAYTIAVTDSMSNTSYLKWSTNGGSSWNAGNNGKDPFDAYGGTGSYRVKKENTTNYVEFYMDEWHTNCTVKSGAMILTNDGGSNFNLTSGSGNYAFYITGGVVYVGSGVSVDKIQNSGGTVYVAGTVGSFASNGGIDLYPVNISRGSHVSSASYTASANPNFYAQSYDNRTLYPSGTSITVSGTADTGYHITGGTGLFTLSSSNTSKTVTAAANTYSVYYNGNGATIGATNYSSHTYDSSKALTANGFSKTGYTFSGWATSQTNANNGLVSYNNQQNVSNLTSTNGGSVTLYAVWTPNTYYIDYYGNGNISGSTDASTHYYDTSKTLTANGYVKTGYTFQGWATSQANASAGTVNYINQQSVINLTNVHGTRIPFYAVWTPNTYTVYYNGNNATSGTTKESGHTYDAAKNLTSNGFLRTGYTFMGWSTSLARANDGTVDYSNQQSVINLTSTHGGRIDLYACWKANTDKLTFNKNTALVSGGQRDGIYPVNGSIPATSTYDKVCTVSSPTCNGYKFVGWELSGYDSSTAKYSTTSDSTATMKNLSAVNGIIEVNNPTAPVYLLNLNPVDQTPVTLKARWEVAKYNITYLDRNGAAYSGNTDLSAEKIYTYGESKNIKKLPVVTKEGYYFVGWFTDAACSSIATRVSQIENTEYGNKTYYARWSKYPLSLQNGSFENPINTSFFRQYYNEDSQIWWKTSATDRKIEIGSVKGSFANSSYSAYHTRVAADGNQFAELNATQVGALYQYVGTVPGETLCWGFSHRGRKGTDTMQVWIGSPKDIETALAQYVASGNNVSGVSETLLNKIAQIPDQTIDINISDSNDTWRSYNGSYIVPTGQDDTAFTFVSVSSAGNDKSIGNLLDYIYFSTELPANVKKIVSIEAIAGGSVTTSEGEVISKSSPYSQAFSEGSVSITPNSITPQEGYTYNGGFVNGVYYNADTMPTSFAYGDIGINTQIIYLFSEDGQVYIQSGEGSYQDEKLTDSMIVLKPEEGKDTYTLGSAVHDTKNFVGWKVEGDDTEQLILTGNTVSYVTDETDGSTYLIVMDKNEENQEPLVKIDSAKGIVLTAQFTNKEIHDQKIILDPDGGKFTDSSIRKNEDGTSEFILDSVDTTYEVKKPTKTGYTFKGWKYTDSIRVNMGDLISYSLSSEYDAQITFGNSAPILMEGGSPITLTAAWEANKYTVSYHANGGQGTMADQELSYDKEETLTKSAYTREGYTFMGWSRSESATEATYTDNQKAVFNMSATNGGSVTLYAVWTKAGDYPTSLQNGSFENPTSSQWTQQYGDCRTTSKIAWYTSASDKKIELGRPVKNPKAAFSAYHTTVASEGNQFAELNANMVGALYQYVSTSPGETLYWGLDHRGRWGDDTMQLWIGTPDEIKLAIEQYKQAGDKVTGVNAQLLAKIAQKPEGQTSADIVDNDSKWVTYNGEYTVPQGQDVSAFAFVSVASAEDNKSCGNLLDNVYFSVVKPVQKNTYKIETTAGGTASVYYDGFKQDENGDASSTNEIEFTAEYGKNVHVVVNENTNYSYNGAYIGGKYYTVDEVDTFLNDLSWTVGNPAQDLDITFLFSADSTIIFAPMGGTYETADHIVEKENLKARDDREYTIKEPALAHYKFAGWLVIGTTNTLLQKDDVVKYETDAAGDTYLNVYRGSSKVYSVASNKGINVVAQYQLDTSTVTTVTFQPNGGYYADAKVIFDGATEYTLGTPIKAGYKFTGWSYNNQTYTDGTYLTFDWDANGSQILTFKESETAQSALATVTGQQAMTLTAQWQEQKYDTVLSTNSANVSAASGIGTDAAGYGMAWTGKIKAATGYSLPENIQVTVDGVAYAGYTYDQNAGTISIPEGVIYGVVEVTARGVEEHYSVSFAQTAHLSMPETTTATYAKDYVGLLTAEDGYKLPADLTATMGGKAFTEFDYNHTSGKITIAANKIVGNVVFRGAATEGVYTMTLDGNGATTQTTKAVYEKYGQGFYKDLVCSSPVSATQSIEIPTKTGYSFAGYYYISANGTKIPYITDSGTIASQLTNKSLTQDVTLYAEWEVNSYSLKSELINMELSEKVGVSDTVSAAFANFFSLSREAATSEGTIQYNKEVKVKLHADTNYDLPKTIEIVRTSATTRATEETLVVGTDYSYDALTGQVVIYGTTITNDLTLRAEATKQQVRLNVSTGVGGQVKAERVDGETLTPIGTTGNSIDERIDIGSNVKLTATADRDNSYSFMGWFDMTSGTPVKVEGVTDNSGSVEEGAQTEYSFTVTNMSQASSYVAVFGKDLTVILDGNGGTFAAGADTTKEIVKGESWELPISEKDATDLSGLTETEKLAKLAPTKDGYQFEGWKLVYASKPDKTGLEFVDGSTDYYSKVTNNYEKPTTQPEETPTTQADEPEIFTATFQATWTPKANRITYQNVNEGEVSSDYTSYETGIGFTKIDEDTEEEIHTFVLPVLARTGYIFNGWKVVANAQNPAEVGNIITAIGEDEYGDKTLEAQWSPITYQINFHANDGNGQMASQVFTYDVSQNLTLVESTITKTGYTFKEWNTQADGKGDVYQDGAQISNLTAVDGAELDLYAMWTPNTYDINYETQGGEIQGAKAEQYTCGTGATLPTTVTKTGYTFAGWYKDSAGSGDPYVSITAEASGDRTYYAKWTAEVYAINYKEDTGASYNDGKTDQYTYGDYVILPTNVTKKGAKFDGWYSDQTEAAVQIKVIDVVDYGDKDLYASWKSASDYETEWKIGDEYHYGSLEEALKNATGEGDIITLQKDVILSKDVTIPEGVTLVIPEDITISINGGYTLKNDGEIENHGYLSGNGTYENHGTITNEDGRIVANVDNTDGTMDGGIITSDGSVTGGKFTGDVINDGTLVNPEIIEGTVTNNKTLIIEAGQITEIVAPGKLINHKDLINNGTITGDGSVENDGTMTNTNGIIDVPTVENENGTIDGGKITENTTINDGTITGSVTNQGTLNDTTLDEDAVVTGGKFTGETINNGKVIGAEEIAGEFDNNGMITIPNGETTKITGTLYNGVDEPGIIDNNGELIISGKIENGTGDVPGTINNGNGENYAGKIDILDGGNLTNGEEGILKNLGTTEHESIINLNKTGTLESTGETEGNENALLIANESAQFDLPEGSSLGTEILDSVKTEKELIAAIENGKTDIKIIGDIILTEDLVLDETIKITIEEGGTLETGENEDGDEVTLTNNGELINQGTIAGNIENNGTFTNEDGTIGDGELETIFTGTGTNEIKGGVIEKETTITATPVSGEVINHGDLTIPPATPEDTVIDGNLINDGTLHIGGGNTIFTGDLTNDGIIENTGNLKVEGNLTNGGDIDNAGDLTVDKDLINAGDGEIKVDGSTEIAGNLDNKDDGKLNLGDDPTDHVNIGGDLHNDGALDITGDTSVENGSIENGVNNPDAVIKNDGTITTDEEIRNGGTIDNKDKDSVILAPAIDNEGGTIDDGTIGKAPTDETSEDGIPTKVIGGTLSGEITNNGEIKGAEIAPGTEITNTELEKEQDVLDENGNPVVDDEGNPEKETIKIPIGTINGCDIPEEVKDDEGNIITPGVVIQGGKIFYRADFNENGRGSLTVSEYGIADGAKVTKPDAPVCIGYLFEGWYQEAECQIAWDFEQDTIQGNVVLFAKWKLCNHENNKTLPTCTSSAICSECGKELPALGHDWSEWTVTETGNCTKAEVLQRTCNRCHVTEMKNGNLGDHEWESDYTIDQAATCVKDGSKSIHCKHCDAVKDSTSIAAIGHKWSKWKVVKKATETKTGLKERTCLNGCGETETAVIPKLKTTQTSDNKPSNQETPTEENQITANVEAVNTNTGGSKPSNHEVLNMIQLSDKNAVDELVQQAMKDGTIVENVANPVGTPGKNITEVGVSIGNLVDVITSVLTEEELVSMAAGTKVNIRVELSDATEKVTADQTKLIEKQLTDTSKVGTVFNVNMFKQLGDQAEEKVESKDTIVSVSFTIPDELKAPEGTNRTYQVMRIYTDENGEEQTEIVEITLEGDTITMNADLTSNYVIIYDDEVPLADGAPEETTDTTAAAGDTDATFALFNLLALILACVVAVLALLKKKKMKWLSCIATIAGIVLYIVTFHRGRIALFDHYSAAFAIVAILALLGWIVKNKKEDEEIV